MILSIDDGCVLDRGSLNQYKNLTCETPLPSPEMAPSPMTAGYNP